VGEKILVVEDNELNLKLFCDLLRAHGYHAEPVRDGREAVARARALRPDLVVMDIQMPHVNGLELIEQMKADRELRPVPIMAVTAYAAKGDEERIREAGAEGYVSKPISLMRFIEAVRGLLAAPRPTEPEPGPELEAESEQEREAAEPALEPEPEPVAEPETDAEAGAEPSEEVRVTRRFKAAAETVFDAWLDPATVGTWLFATPDGEMVRVAVEPWPGGRYEIVEKRGREEVVHAGLYESVERPWRLAFTLRVPLYSSNEEQVAVTIETEGEGSRLTLAQTRAADAPATAGQITQGWAAILDALAARLGEEGEEE
jgi:two-component system cell cycle response regulator DivK